MSSTVFYEGADELAVLTATFKVGAVLTDPSTVTLTITDPTGVTSTPSTTHVSTGVFTASIPCTINGLWSYEWDGSGAASDIQAGTWYVTPATVRNFYTSIEQLKSRLGITDTQDDFEVAQSVEAAAEWINQFTGRFFWNESGVRTYRNNSIYDVEIDDLISVTQLATDQDGDGIYETVWTASQFQLEVTEHIYNPAAKGEWWPYTKIQALGVPGGNYLPYVWAWSHQDRTQVTGNFGWLNVPVLVRQASLQLAVDYFKLKDAPFGVAGYGDYGPMRVMENPMIAGMLRRYVRPRVRVGV